MEALCPIMSVNVVSLTEIVCVRLYMCSFYLQMPPKRLAWPLFVCRFESIALSLLPAAFANIFHRR